MAILISIKNEYYVLERNPNLFNSEFLRHCSEINTEKVSFEMKIDDMHYPAFKLILDDDFLPLWRLIVECIHYTDEGEYLIMKEKVKLVDEIYLSLGYFGHPIISEIPKVVASLYVEIQRKIYQSVNTKLINRMGYKPGVLCCGSECYKSSYMYCKKRGSIYYEYHIEIYNKNHAFTLTCFFRWYELKGRNNGLGKKDIFVFNAIWRKHIVGVLNKLINKK